MGGGAEVAVLTEDGAAVADDGVLAGAEIGGRAAGEELAHAVTARAHKEVRTKAGQRRKDLKDKRT